MQCSLKTDIPVFVFVSFYVNSFKISFRGAQHLDFVRSVPSGSDEEARVSGA